MLSVIEIAELMVFPSRFYSDPERKNEGFWTIQFRILPSIVIFLILNTFTLTYVFFVSTVDVLISDYIITAVVASLIFISLAIQLRIFGYSVLQTYQAFMYGLVSFLMVGGLSGSIGMLWTLFSTYWGLVVLHKIEKTKALLVIIIPTLIIILWQYLIVQGIPLLV